MTPEALRELLEQVRRGTTPVDAALEHLRDLPYADLGHTKLDLHRHLRRGQPEAIFGQGKTAEQVCSIAGRLASSGQNVLVTRATPEHAEALRTLYPNEPIEYHSAARLILWRRAPVAAKSGIVAVVCAGTTDMPVAEEAALTAQAFGNHVERIYDVGVAGIHRLLAHRDRLVAARVLIVVAGMEGALPSVVAGLVRAPVIAVPTSVGYGANFHGLSALLTMLNSCSPGIAVVNIDNGFGAGCLADLINTPPPKDA